MYVILCGPPAAKKGTAISQGRKMIEELGLSVAPDDGSKEALVAKLMKSRGEDIDLDGNSFTHCSMTIMSRELGVLFNNKQDSGLLPYLCDWFDCVSSFEYSTRSRGDEEARNVWVNLLAATPLNIEKNLPQEAVGSGFTSRTIFVCEDEPGKTVYLPQSDRNKRENLLKDLTQIFNMVGPFSYTEEFFEAYKKWRDKWDGVVPNNNKKLEYYAARRMVHLLKLSIIISAARSPSQVIQDEDLYYAAAIIQQAEANMGKAFGGIGDNPLASLQNQIVDLLLKQGEITDMQLVKTFMSEASANDINQVMNTLQTAGLCKYVKEKGAKTRGKYIAVQGPNS